MISHLYFISIFIAFSIADYFSIPSIHNTSFFSGKSSLDDSLGHSLTTGLKSSKKSKTSSLSLTYIVFVHSHSVRKVPEAKRSTNSIHQFTDLYLIIPEQHTGVKTPLDKCPSGSSFMAAVGSTGTTGFIPFILCSDGSALDSLGNHMMPKIIKTDLTIRDIFSSDILTQSIHHSQHYYGSNQNQHQVWNLYEHLHYHDDVNSLRDLIDELIDQTIDRTDDEARNLLAANTVPPRRHHYPRCYTASTPDMHLSTLTELDAYLTPRTANIHDDNKEKAKNIKWTWTEKLNQRIFKGKNDDNSHMKTKLLPATILKRENESVLHRLDNYTIVTSTVETSDSTFKQNSQPTVNFIIHVQGNLPDRPADRSQCSWTNNVALPTCTLRSAWSLCSSLVNESTSTHTDHRITCTLSLPANGVFNISGKYGPLTLNYNATGSDSNYVVYDISGNYSSTIPSTILGDKSAAQFLNVNGHVEINLRHVEITGFGDGTRNGGSIYFGANVRSSVTDSVFSFNAGLNGGAIYYYKAGSCTVLNSTFANNTSCNGTNTNGEQIINLTYSNSSNTLNSTITRGGDGGAIYYYFSQSCKISGSTFIDNAASGPGQGGAIYYYCSQSCDIGSSAFIENIVLGGGYGGAIYYYYCHACFISNSTFTGNSAPDAGYGGAIYYYFSHTCDILRSKFTSNSVTGGGYGGAIASLFTQLCHISSSTFNLNTAGVGYGGAVYYYSAHWCTVSNNTFTNNFAVGSGYGGAIYFGYSQSCDVASSIFTGNSASGAGKGGAIYYYFSNSCSIVSNAFGSNTGGSGGAIYYWSSHSCSIVSCTFTSNSALIVAYGGAIYYWTSQSCDIKDSAFIVNSAPGTSYGGAIYYSSSKFCEILRCKFIGNSASGEGYGGAVAYLSSQSCHISSSTFLSNTAGAGFGGALYYYTSQSCVNRNNTFSNNFVSGGGNAGAIYFGYSYFCDIISCVFTSNSNAYYGSGGLGGALYYFYSHSSNISSSKFTSNTCGTSGGAIAYWNSQYCNISSSIFTENSLNEVFGGYGGTIYYYSSQACNVMTSLFLNNSVSYGGSGGAIYYYLSHLCDVIACSFYRNTINVGGSGGAISYSTSQSCHVISSHFANNTVTDDGGAIYYYYSQLCNISSSTFTGNTVTGAGQGGAISYKYPQLCTINNSSFSNNSALSGGDGGAVSFLSPFSCGIDNCTFTNNTALAGGSGGAILYKFPKSCDIVNSTFISNKVFRGGYGGAIYYISSLSCNISSSTFVSNAATVGGSGGAIYYESSQSSSVVSTTFTSNIASGGYGGGAIYYFNSSQFCDISSSTFSKNTVNDAGYGGAVTYWSSQSCSINNNLFTGNSVTGGGSGGAIYYYSSKFCDIRSSTFKGNNVIEGGDGGAIAYIISKFCVVGNNTFSGNSATSGRGGAVFYISSSTCDLADCVMKRSVSLSGGAVYYLSTSNATVRNCDFFYNSAVYNAGAIEFDASPFSTISRSEFRNNVATAYYSTGGAIFYAQGSSGAFIFATLFSGNSAYSAGTIISFSDRFVVSESHFLNNYALNDGGGIIALDSRHWVISDNVFKSNEAINNGGAILAINCSDVTIIRNILTNNSASNSGGALFVQSSSEIEISLSSFRSNSATTYSGAIHSTTNFNFVISKSLIFGNIANIGGGASIIESSNVNFRESNIHSNAATVSGGGIYFDHSGSLIGFSNCSFINNNAVVGGAVAFDSSCQQAEIQSSTFQHNAASYGGAVSFAKSNGQIRSSLLNYPFLIQNCVLSSNLATAEGGSIYLNQTNVVALINTTVKKSQSRLKGGAISANNNNRLLLISVAVQECVAATYGGAIYAESYNQLQLANFNSFTSNKVNITGGAVFCNSSNELLYDANSYVLFKSNSAKLTGSAIYLGLSSNMNSSNSKSALRFEDNMCTGAGCGFLFLAQSKSLDGQNNPSLILRFRDKLKISWADNVGSFNQTSQPVTFVSNLPKFTITYQNSSANGNAVPPVTLVAYDQFNQQSLSDSESFVKVSILTSHCGNIAASLSGGNYPQQLRQGQTTFNGLFVTCTPGGNVTLLFTGSIVDSAESYSTITSKMIISFPECRAGYQEVNGDCLSVTSSAVQSDNAYITPLAASLSSVLIGIPLCFLVIWYLMSAIELSRLPTHYALRKSRSVEDIFETIKLAPLLTLEKAGGKTALEIAIDLDVDFAIILSLVLVSLPVDVVTKEATDDEKKKHVWTKFIQSDTHVEILESVLQNHYDIAPLLFHLKDNKGRSIANQATPKCFKCLEQATYFLKRYVLSNASSPQHRSDSCILHIANDMHLEGAVSRVALKFMKSYEMYLAELNCRSRYKISDSYVIGVIGNYDSTQLQNIDVSKQFSMYGFIDYNYLIVMPAADINLSAIFTNENIAGIDIAQGKSIAREVISALAHIHSRGIIHGDIKPMNIMRMNGKMILIDMDASASIDTDYAATKCSSGYCPPELIYVTGGDVDSGFIRIPIENAPYELVKASESFDAWSLGVVLYELFTGRRLFEVDSRGNADPHTLRIIHQFDDSFKLQRLKLIEDLLARNLVSQLLHKQASKRPAMKLLLNHAFLKSNIGFPVFQHKALYDVFISYRVDADAAFAKRLYQLCTDAGISVFLDSFCLNDGEPWDVAFTNALSTSTIFLPLLSRNAINHPTADKQNFTKLLSSSKCDNVLLEHRLALELKDGGFVSSIFPVLIGQHTIDTKGATIYGGFFRDGSAPVFEGREVHVNSVDLALTKHLDRLGLGTPLSSGLSVSETYSQIVKFQGFFFEGEEETAFITLVQRFTSMKAVLVQQAAQRELPAGSRLTIKRVTGTENSTVNQGAFIEIREETDRTTVIGPYINPMSDLTRPSATKAPQYTIWSYFTSLWQSRHLQQTSNLIALDESAASKHSISTVIEQAI